MATIEQIATDPAKTILTSLKNVENLLARIDADYALNKPPSPEERVRVLNEYMQSRK
jgi:hypothetical protein